MVSALFMLLHLDTLLFGMKHNQKLQIFHFMFQITLTWNETFYLPSMCYPRILSDLSVYSIILILIFTQTKKTEFWIPYSASYFFECPVVSNLIIIAINIIMIATKMNLYIEKNSTQKFYHIWERKYVVQK